MKPKLVVGLTLILIGSFSTPRLGAAETNKSLATLIAEFKNFQVFWQQFEIAKMAIDLNDKSVLPQLTDYLTSDDRHVRGNAAFIFARIGDDRGFQILTEILADRSDRPKGQGVNANWTLQAQVASDRYYAVHLFGDLKDLRAVPILIPLLHDQEVKDIVPWSLGQIGDRRAIEPLIGELSDPSPSSRVLAIYALEELRAVKALPRLRELSSSDEKSNFGDFVTVGQAATAAIIKIQSSQDSDGQKSKWVADCLKDFAEIKVGMRRREVRSLFPRDGGIYSASLERFRHPACAYFKINVEFNFKRDAADQNRAIMGEDDPVTHVSKPYIETPYSD
jgi:HEAT repeat protein